MNRQFDEYITAKNNTDRLIKKNFRHDILEQAKLKEEERAKERFEDMKPHIAGTQGYPQLPQLSDREAREIKKSNQSYMKNNLLKQILEKERLKTV